MVRDKERKERKKWKECEGRERELLGGVKLREKRERVLVGRKRELIVSRNGGKRECLWGNRERARERERVDCESEGRKEGMLVRK